MLKPVDVQRIQWIIAAALCPAPQSDTQGVPAAWVVSPAGKIQAPKRLPIPYPFRTG